MITGRRKIKSNNEVIKYLDNRINLTLSTMYNPTRHSLYVDDLDNELNNLYKQKRFYSLMDKKLKLKLHLKDIS